MWDEAQSLYNRIDRNFQQAFDTSFHHGIFLKTRHMFLLGYIIEHSEHGRVFLVEYLRLVPPATLRDVCSAIRAEFHRDLPNKIAFMRGLRDGNGKGLRFYDPLVIERSCDRFSPSS